MTEQLVCKFKMEMIAPDCTPGASWWGVKVKFDNDISDVFPYMNAELDETDYNHNSKILIWNGDDGLKYAFRPNEIAVAPVEDRKLAEDMCDRIVGLVNDIWSRRSSIDPSIKAKMPPPSMLVLLKLLPGTNCKECGCATCMAFAAGLIQEQVKLSECSQLSQEAYDELERVLSRS